MSLKGGPELRARLRAIKLAFKPIGRAWAEEDVRQNRARVPRRTGYTAASFRVRNATQRKAVVVGSYVANFIDAGTKAHDIVPRKGRSLKFEANGRTIFSKKVHHPRTGAQPFKRAAALEALRKNPLAAELIKQWNQAR